MRLIRALLLALALLLAFPFSASAQDCEGSGPPEDECIPGPEVESGSIEPDIIDPGINDVQPQVAAPVQTEGLPVTGAETMALVGAGVALTAAGGAVLIARRRVTADA